MPEFTKVDCEPTDGSNDLCLLVNFQPWTAKGVKDVILLKSLDAKENTTYNGKLKSEGKTVMLLPNPEDQNGNPSVSGILYLFLRIFTNKFYRMTSF